MLTVLSGRRLAAALILLTVAGAAVATAASVPDPQLAAGTASSHLTVLDVSVAGQPIRVGDLLLAGSDADASAAFTALTSGGTSYGDRRTSAGALEVPSIDSATVLPASLSKLVTVVTPAASMTAGNGSARAGLDSLGSVRILGMPLALDGTVATTVGVDGTHASSQKTLVVRNVALPSISGLLTALGLDIAKLPTSTLLSLVDQLSLVDGTITDARVALDAALGPLQPQLAAAQQQVTEAQAAAEAAKADVAAQTAAVTSAADSLAAATASLQALLGTSPHLLRAALLGLPTPSPLAILPTALPSVTPVPTALPTTLPTILPTPLPTELPTALPTDLPTALPTSLPTVLPTVLPSLPAVLPADAQVVVDTYDAAASAYADAVEDLNAATGVLNVVNNVLNTASGTVNTLLSTVQTQVEALVHAVLEVLGSTPLVAIDSFTIRAEAAVTSATKGGQTAHVVGGELQGVHVLGNDVLSQTLNTDRIDLSYLGGAPLDLLNQRIAALTSRLAGVLSAVPGLPTLSMPAPKIELLSTSTATNITGGFGAARTTLKALQITLPAITIPPAVQTAVPVGSLSVKAVGDLLSRPLVVSLGTMEDTATFRPAAGNTVVPPGGGLAGSPAGNPTGAGPTGSTPTGSTPAGSNPTGANPNGTTPDGTTPNGTPIAGGPNGNPQLPRTGLPAGVALTALLLVGTGLAFSRVSERGCGPDAQSF